jgi:hypothetical protein
MHLKPILKAIACPIASEPINVNINNIDNESCVVRAYCVRYTTAKISDKNLRQSFDFLLTLV